MSIRLNKAIVELNIGLQTAVEFLQKRPELGEVKADTNFKLSDEQYDALKQAYKQDAEVRNKAGKLFMKKPKEKKRPVENVERPAENTSVGVQQFKPLGKIDLDSLGKKPKPAPAAPERKEKEIKEEVPVEVEEKKVEETPAPQQVQTEEPAKTAEVAEVKKEEAPRQEPEAVALVAEQPKEALPEDKEEEKTESKQGSVFTLKSEQRLGANEPKVLGKIDLSQLNQSTLTAQPEYPPKEKEQRGTPQGTRGEDGASSWLQ